MARTKLLTSAIYSPTKPASEAAIRQQIDDSIQEVYDDAAKGDEVGGRQYTQENYVTDSETVTASIDALDVQLKVATDRAEDTFTKDEINSVVDSSSGADEVGVTPITETGAANRVQAVFEALIARLKSIVNGSSGADLIGATTIVGIVGNTVQTILENMKTYIDNLAPLNIADNSITNKKLVDDPDGIKNAVYGSSNINALDYKHNQNLADNMFDDSLWTASAGTKSADTVNFKVGSQSLKSLENDTIAGGVSNVKESITLDLSELSNGDPSTEDDDIKFVFFISDINAVNVGGGSNGVQLAFSQDATFSTTNIKFINNLLGLVEGWNYLTIKKSAFSTLGGGAWDGIQSIRVLWSSTVNSLNDYVSFQVIQLVKEGGYFQKQGKSVYTENDEIYLGEEDGNYVIKDFGTDGFIKNALITTDQYTNIKSSNIRKGTVVDRSIYGNVFYVDSLNNILTYVSGGLFKLDIVEAGATISVSATFPLTIGDSVLFTLDKQDGNVLATVMNLTTGLMLNLEGETTLTDGYLSIGTDDGNQVYLKSATVTELENSYHSDVSEIARSVEDTNGGAVLLWTGSQAQYDALTPLDDTIYFIE